MKQREEAKSWCTKWQSTISDFIFHLMFLCVRSRFSVRWGRLPVEVQATANSLQCYQASLHSATTTIWNSLHIFWIIWIWNVHTRRMRIFFFLPSMNGHNTNRWWSILQPLEITPKSIKIVMQNSNGCNFDVVTKRSFDYLIQWICAATVRPTELHFSVHNAHDRYFFREKNHLNFRDREKKWSDQYWRQWKSSSTQSRKMTKKNRIICNRKMKQERKRNSKIIRRHSNEKY